MSDEPRIEGDEEERVPEPPRDEPTASPRPAKARFRYRLSGLGCVALFLTGILLGAVVGLLFYRHRMARATAPAVVARPTSVPAPNPAAPPVVAPLPPPRMVFGPTSTAPKETPEVMEAGLVEVYSFFEVPEAPATAPVTLRWILGDRQPLDAQAEVTKEPGYHLRGSAALKPPLGAKGFAEGIYEVELLVNGARALEGSFAVLKGGAALLKTPKGMERYRPDIQDLTVSAGPATTPPKKPFVLPATPAKVLLRFKYAYALPGTAFTVYWLYEDGLIAQATTEINIQKDSGTAEAWFGPKPPAKLPAGKYGVMIGLSAGTPALAKEDFWIGRQPTAKELGPEAGRKG